VTTRRVSTATIVHVIFIINSTKRQQNIGHQFTTLNTVYIDIFHSFQVMLILFDCSLASAPLAFFFFFFFLLLSFFFSPSVLRHLIFIS